MKGIFDVKDTTDLPETIRRELVNKNRLDNETVIELFEYAGCPLNLNQIQVALWRKYGIIARRHNLNVLMNRLCKAEKPIFKRNDGRKRGNYYLVKRRKK